MKVFKQIPPLINTKRINNDNKQRKWISPLKSNIHTLYKSNSNINILHHNNHHNIPPIKLPYQFNAILQPAISSNNIDRNKGLHLYLINHKHHLTKRNTSPQVVLMKDESSSTREDIHNLLY